MKKGGRKGKGNANYYAVSAKLYNDTGNCLTSSLPRERAVRKH